MSVDRTPKGHLAGHNTAHSAGDITGHVPGHTAPAAGHSDSVHSRPPHSSPRGWRGHREPPRAHFGLYGQRCRSGRGHDEAGGHPPRDRGQQHGVARGHVDGHGRVCGHNPGASPSSRAHQGADHAAIHCADHTGDHGAGRGAVADRDPTSAGQDRQLDGCAARPAVVDAAAAGFAASRVVGPPNTCAASGSAPHSSGNLVAAGEASVGIKDRGRAGRCGEPVRCPLPVTAVVLIFLVVAAVIAGVCTGVLGGAGSGPGAAGWQLAHHTGPYSPRVVAYTDVLAQGQGGESSELLEVLGRLRNWIMAFLSALATVIFTLGAVRYLLANGQIDEIEAAKRAFKGAAFGYALAALAPAVVAILRSIVGV